ncbi:GGDEF domain-containing protein [Noviherbaspirillum aerium]|uniref:GGDEF domain-containing protein n=1 Tax=Noviherbaspirillum aerium TaxID=2588497 RepID=UPI001CEFA2C4|nr:GGDEF domain-containing protein [Noviherbaspirillum aerium]
MATTLMLSTKQVFLIASLLCFVTFLVLFSFRENGVKGMRQVILASVLGMAGNILFAYGRELSPFFAYELANGVYAASSAAILIGYRRLFKRPAPTRPLALGVLGLTAAIAFFHYVQDSFIARTTVASLFQAGVAGAISYTLLRARSEWRRPYYPKFFILAMCGLIAGGHAIRVLYQLFSDGAPASLLEPSGWNVFVLSAGAFALPVLAFGALLIAHRRIVLLAEHAANHDYLTGAWSRRAFFDIGNREISRTTRTDRPLSLLLVDMDNFKPVNDTSGHIAGDRVLQDIVHEIHQELRSIDSLCRMGGDEFAVLMPETDLAGAAVVAERLRLRIAAAHELLSGVTVSIGVAALQKEDTLKSLMMRADTALYVAKEKGRNQVALEKEYRSLSYSTV